MKTKRKTRGHHRRKRQAVSEDSQKRPKDLPVILLLIIAASAMMAVTFVLQRQASDNVPVQMEFVSVEELGAPPIATKLPNTGTAHDPQSIEISLSQFESNSRVQFFEYSPSSGSRIRFMAAVRSDGKVVPALDTCEGCYHQNRGFSPFDGHIACRKCGRSFAVDRLGDDPSTCHPIVIPHVLNNGSLVLNTHDLETLSEKFKPDSEQKHESMP